jgi:uncharacterized membrane protein YfcA
VNFEVAVFVCLGCIIGGFFGAKLATGLSSLVLGKVLGIAMLAIALKMFLAK